MTKIADSLDGFYINHVSRYKNSNADSLASLITTLALPTKITKHIIIGNKCLFCPKPELVEFTPGNKQEANEVQIAGVDFEPRIGVFQC